MHCLQPYLHVQYIAYESKYIDAYVYIHRAIYGLMQAHTHCYFRDCNMSVVQV
jgi:hypothetical protein